MLWGYTAVRPYYVVYATENPQFCATLKDEHLLRVQDQSDMSNPGFAMLDP